MPRRNRDDRQMALFDAPAPGPSVAGPALEEPPPSPADAPPPPPDASDRAFATDPRHNVVLEASAGTGKTTVLVQRYLNLLGAGVDPSHILAMTFTRKAAAEMRQRIVAELRRDGTRSPEGRRRWLRVRDRVGDIGISTIDAFCLSLLREFPLEAGLDPSFQVADETEVARLVERTLDETLRVARARARREPDVAFALTQLTPRQLRDGLRHLLDRRAVALPALAGYLARVGAPATAGEAVRAAVTEVLEAIERDGGGLAPWIANGPLTAPSFAVLAQDVSRVHVQQPDDDAEWRRAFDRLRDCFLTKESKARSRPQLPQRCFASKADYARHRDAVAAVGPLVAAAAGRLDAQVNAVLARGILTLARIAESIYLRALDDEDVLDFTETLRRAVDLLRRMDEFSRSRFRLESRYHHVLVDEFQDTNRLQWELVSLLVQAWGAGEGLVGDPLPPTVFVVGDRKQSIYRFRDAEVALLDEAARHIASLKTGEGPRRSISTSFRAAPALLAFVNDVFGDVPKAAGRADAFRYDAADRFPLLTDPIGHAEPAVGFAAAPAASELAEVVAGEIVRLVRSGQAVRDRETGLARPVRPGDVAILFRTRDSHRDYERALEARGVPTYVYKGLGFFDADEIQDLTALVRYLADPTSRLREAALLRSRFFRLSDAALAALADDLGRVLRGRRPPAGIGTLEDDDRERLEMARAGMVRWLALVDRLPPADLVDRIVRETAFAFELRGARLDQARENVKKFRGLVRRIQNRGYATMGRIAEHVDRLSVGDESNAAIDAVNAVNLMTVHASKGLEFPVVFVVNLAKGSGTGGGPVRVVAEDGDGQPAVSIGALRFEADEEEKLRDREETKRLLYVALTRARDRLYLASALTPDGKFRPAPGSLAEVLPATLWPVMELAAGGGDLCWTAASGVSHALHRCAAAPAGALPAGEAEREERTDLLGHVAPDPALPVRSVRAMVQPAPAPARRAWEASNAEGVVTGRLVHRLFQLVDPCHESTVDDEALASQARAALRVEEREALEDEAAAIAEACRTWRWLARTGAAAGLFDGERHYEVPFTLLPAEEGGARDVTGERHEPGERAAARGVIDCLVRQGDEVRVIEVKTGRRAEWHARQLDLYLRAAEALFPGARVTGVLLAPDEVV